MAYNPWYTDTYEPILKLALWEDFSADIEKKIIGIFSWMPQTIMAVKHAGGRKKYELHSVQSMREALETVKANFERIKISSLPTLNLSEHEKDIEALCHALFPMMGSVGASKYLHFSCPRVLPMWDRQIRADAKCEDSVAGYIKFLKLFQQELADEGNRRLAARKYPTNLVRGWDIVRMERRTRRAEQAAARDRVIQHST